MGAPKAERLCRGPLTDHDINGAILHRWVEHLLHGAPETVDLVNKEHLPRHKVRQDRGKITAMINGGAGGEADLHTELVRNNRRQRCLPKAGWPVQEEVVGRLTTLARRL